jgi:hypothetical protein
MKLRKSDWNESKKLERQNIYMQKSSLFYVSYVYGGLCLTGQCLTLSRFVCCTVKYDLQKSVKIRL